MEELITDAAHLFGVARHELTGSSCTRDVVIARHATAWALRRYYPDLSFARIGQLLGGRHHTTIMAAIARAEVRAVADVDYALMLVALVRS